SGPVVLEALSGVDTADLPEATRVARPEVRRWNAGDGLIRLGVPRPPPLADDDVVDERLARVGSDRVAPGPAVPGRDAGGISAARVLRRQPGFEGFRRWQHGYPVGLVGAFGQRRPRDGR